MVSLAVVRVRQLYGAHPLQLILILASFAVVGYALWLLGFAALWNAESWWQSIAVWFVGAALAHDLLLFPAYAAADRILVAVTGRRARTAHEPVQVPVVNFVRVPLLAVGVVTLIFLPGIIEQGADTYVRATGQTQEPFLLRWLLLCLVILLSGPICYVIARTTSARRRTSGSGSSSHATDDGMPTPSPQRVEATTSAWTVVVLAVLVALAARGRRADRP